MYRPECHVSFRQRITSAPARGDRLHYPRSLDPMVRAAELLVFRGHDEGLRDEIEIPQAFRVLHPLDVLVETVFSRQFVRSREMVDALVRSQRPQNTLFPQETNQNPSVIL